MDTTRHVGINTLSTSWGPIDYREIGRGRPLLFVHGILMNGHLWDHVVARLPDDLRLICPDLPLGGHRRAAPKEADMSLPSLAGLVLEMIERLELDDLTLVGNDTGGALCQVVVTRDDPRVKRIGRLFLTNCDAFEAFPPTSFAILRALAVPAPRAVGWMTALLTRMPLGRRLFFATAAYSRRPDAEMVALVGGFNDDPAVRRDAMKVLTAMAPRYTLDAASRLGSFDRPVHIIWGLNDLFFPVALGERLQKALPNATLQRVADARLFISLDQPEAVADALSQFVRTTGRAPSRVSSSGASGIEREALVAGPAGRRWPPAESQNRPERRRP